MSSGARVLTGLMERRALETAFQALAQTTSLDELVGAAQAIAERGSAAVPVLLSFLDTTDPQLRGGLGQVAARLDRDQVVPALKAVARSHERTDHARLTAMMILDRYLHESVDESLLSGLQDPEAVAIQSLRELSHEMANSPFVVIEYLTQLGEQPAEVSGVVLDAIPRLSPDPHLVTLLRMFAQGGDAALAQKAIEQLSRTRLPEAARALAALALTLPPEQVGLAQRGLRKLRLLGVNVPDPADPAGWRALLSPLDGTGAQVVWFVQEPGDRGQGTLFSVLCRDPEGVIASFGSSAVPAEDLPPSLPLGADYVVRQAEDTLPIRLIEVPLDAGRRVVRAALELNWARGAQGVPPAEYRLLNPWIWEPGPLGQETAVEPGPYTPAAASVLLDHPAFASWIWQSAEVYEAAEGFSRRPLLSERTSVVKRLLVEHFGSDLVASYQRRLAGMARWLALANAPAAARLAAAAAIHLPELPPAQAPFFQRLVGSSLDVAVANLRSGFDWRRLSAAA